MRKGFVIGVLLMALGVWWWIETTIEEKPPAVHRVKQVPMDDRVHERLSAFDTLNRVRETMGMPILLENHILQKAAQAHADYLVLHQRASHHERAGEEGFTGTKPMDRALRAGYQSRFVGENLSTSNHNALGSVRGLFSAIYHRFSFLNPGFDEVGIGIAQDPDHPENSAFVYLMGNHDLNRLCTEPGYAGAGRYVYGVCADTQHRIDARTYHRARDAIRERSAKIILYPHDGEIEVPPAFYNEKPDPLPEYDVSGFPVSVEFNDRFFRKVELVSFRLFVDGGEEVTEVRLLDKSTDPHHKLTRRQFALMPLKRLEYGTKYRAELLYRHKGKKKKIVWTFTTIKPTEKLITLYPKDNNLTLSSGRGYWLYFVPHDAKDVLGTVRYPKNIFVRFIDRNTLRLVLDSKRTRGFEIGSDERKVRIEIDK